MQDSANQTFSVDYQTALQVEGGRDMFYELKNHYQIILCVTQDGRHKMTACVHSGAGHGFAVIAERPRNGKMRRG